MLYFQPRRNSDWVGIWVASTDSLDLNTDHSENLKLGVTMVNVLHLAYLHHLLGPQADHAQLWERGDTVSWWWPCLMLLWWRTNIRHRGSSFLGKRGGRSRLLWPPWSLDARSTFGWRMRPGDSARKATDLELQVSLSGPFAAGWMSGVVPVVGGSCEEWIREGPTQIKDAALHDIVGIVN